MSQTYVFLPPAACAGAQAELPVQWVADGVSETLAFSEVQAQVGGSWTLVLPVEAVTSCAVNLPTRKARWLRQALPFAVEELLAEEVELMHLALGEQLADGRHRVFACAAAGWLAGWRCAPQRRRRLSWMPICFLDRVLRFFRCTVAGCWAARMSRGWRCRRWTGRS